MSKDCAASGGNCVPEKKKGCCSLKKTVGFLALVGIAGFLWKKFK